VRSRESLILLSKRKKVGEYFLEMTLYKYTLLVLLLSENSLTTHVGYGDGAVSLTACNFIRQLRDLLCT
jgi:hypothetical protein